VRIYTFDHPPAHVYVEKGGASVKIDLATNLAVRIAGPMSDRDVKKAERIVATHAESLRTAWRRLHGRR
jgi:hypothetical protein